MHRRTGFLLLLSSLVMHAPSFAMELIPFRAHYSASFHQGINLSGSAVRELKPLDEGRWRLSLDARALIARIDESSLLRLDRGQIQPLEYQYQRKVLGKTQQRHARFDPDNPRLDAERAAEGQPAPCAAPLYDNLSYQLQLWQDAQDGRQTMDYCIVDGKRVKQYAFRVVGEESLPIGDQHYATWVIERDRGAESERQTRIWLSREQPFLIVKLLQVEDGKRYQILLERVEYGAARQAAETPASDLGFGDN